MNKLSCANVRRLLNLLFLKPGFKGRLFARVGDHRPCLRLHLVRLACWGFKKFLNISIPCFACQSQLSSMAKFQFRDCAQMTSSWDYSWADCGLALVLVKS